MLQLITLMRLPIGVLLLWAGMGFAFTTQANDRSMDFGGNPVWKDGRLAHLSKYIGTENNRAVLEEPYIIEQLKWDLQDRYDLFRKAILDTPVIIGFDLFHIVLRGFAPGPNKEGVEAILVVNLRNGWAFPGIRIGKKRIVYGNKGPDEKDPTFGELPWPLLIWSRYDEIWRMFDKPPTENFEWKHHAPPPEPN